MWKAIVETTIDMGRVTKKGERETKQRERDPALNERLRDPAHAIKRSCFLMRMY